LHTHGPLWATQDLVLGEVGAGVDRLHERAVNIHDETKVRLIERLEPPTALTRVNTPCCERAPPPPLSLSLSVSPQLHVRLLSDMDHDVEKALGGLRAETKHAVETRKKTGNCSLYVCIVVLLILLVLLLVLSS